jgi:hypothetical protein
MMECIRRLAYRLFLVVVEFFVDGAHILMHDLPSGHTSTPRIILLEHHWLIDEERNLPKIDLSGDSVTFMKLFKVMHMHEDAIASLYTCAILGSDSPMMR